MAIELDAIFSTNAYWAHLDPLNAVLCLLKTILEIIHDYQITLAW